MKKFYKLLFRINVIIACITGLAYLAPFINPNQFWPISFLGLGYPILLTLNALLIVFWIVIKPKFAILSILTVALGYQQLYNLYSLPIQQQKITDTHQQVKVLSYNLSQLNRIHNLPPNSKATRSEHFAEFLQQENPDFICLQETSLKNVEEVKRLWGQDVFYHHKNYTAILSKYPITKTGYIKDRDSNIFATWIDVSIRDTSMRIYSVYLQSNQITTDADQLIKEGDLQEQKTWQKISMILSKYKDAARNRSGDIVYLQEHMAAANKPLLLCGDFNDVPHSYVYRQLSKDLYDTFHFSRGMHSTYGGNIPFLRIDFILASPFFQTGTFEREMVEYSDHFPIMSTLAF